MCAKERSMFLDRQGQPIEADEWSRLLGNDDYRCVGYDEVGPVRISTVWLGLDHDYGLTGRPLIFETLVRDSPLAEMGRRWSTETDAHIGHHEIVRQVERALRVPHGSQEDRIMPNDDRPLADVEPGSVDITALDKAELLAALVNATDIGGPLAQAFKEVPELVTPMTHELAAAIIQNRLGAGTGKPFDFVGVHGRPLLCDITGPRISARDVARYDGHAGAGTMARVVDELRAAYEQRRAERERREEP